MMERVNLARYLFARLRQLGVGAVHGVPSDYMVKSLDHLAPAGLRCIGSCNELNASYAADGYARATGISALMTTSGVGELSAINAGAGSCAEYTLLVYIVGTPARKHQKSRATVHHRLGGGRMRAFADMAKHVTAAQANLTDAKSAPAMVDKVLQECVLQSRPVYVELPSDMADAQVSGLGLDQPLMLMSPGNATESEDAVIDLLLDRIPTSKQPMILVDGLAARYDISNELHELIQTTSFPTLALPFGGGIADHSLDNYHGVHAGKFGKLDFTSHTDSADLVFVVRASPERHKYNRLVYCARSAAYDLLPQDQG